MESIGMIIAAILTLMVFSYILGDNALFKVAAHIFVGVAIGYALIVVWYSVFLPAFQLDNLDNLGDLAATVPAMLICLLLLFKLSPAPGPLANALGGIGLAFILGMGAALALGGALFGTLLPQVSATTALSLNPGDYTSANGQVGLVEWLNNVIIILGTLGTFAYFTFAVRAPGPLGGLREGVVRFFAGMGRLMIVFTLGALFANTVSSRVALLVSRIEFLTSFFGG